MSWNTKIQVFCFFFNPWFIDLLFHFFLLWNTTKLFTIVTTVYYTSSHKQKRIHNNIQGLEWFATSHEFTKEGVKSCNLLHSTCTNPHTFCSFAGLWVLDSVNCFITSISIYKEVRELKTTHFSKCSPDRVSSFDRLRSIYLNLVCAVTVYW